jgi:hypothetical protein
MLPEFPRAYDAIQKVWYRILFDAAGFSDPLISQVAVRVQREGHRAFLGESEIDYEAKRVSHQWTPEVGKGIPTEEFFGLPLRVGKEMASKQAESVFKAMSEASPHTGTVDKSDGPFTFDLWLKKMAAFELDFKDDGLPRWPQWFLSDEAMAEFQKQQGEGGLTEEQIQRQAELVARKRKEFDERESRRRLVE